MDECINEMDRILALKLFMDVNIIILHKLSCQIHPYQLLSDSLVKIFIWSFFLRYADGSNDQNLIMDQVAQKDLPIK